MKKLNLIIGILLLVLGIALSLAIRFTHISETETQLFLNHWVEWLVATVLIIVGYLFISVLYIAKKF